MLMPPKTASSADQTRQRIIHAAERLFLEHGFDGTSLRLVTSSARVNLGAVNYHFGGKDALFEAISACSPAASMRCMPRGCCYWTNIRRRRNRCRHVSSYSQRFSNRHSHLHANRSPAAIFCASWGVPISILRRSCAGCSPNATDQPLRASRTPSPKRCRNCRGRNCRGDCISCSARWRIPWRVPTRGNSFPPFSRITNATMNCCCAG